MTLASVRRLLASGRCAWMLAWALCLPLAQWAGAVHALQHLRPVVSEHRELPAQLPQACDLCLAAAAIGGGAPLPSPSALALVVLPQQPAAAAPVAHHVAPPPRYYASRAPPLLHA